MAKRARRLTRDDISIPADTNETAADLGRKLSKAKAPRGLKGKHKVPRGSIRVAAKVFQWRNFGKHVGPRDEHILGMAKNVIDSNEPLDPLLVLPVGTTVYVVDGHHRLAAYDTALWTKHIPVVVFDGTLEQARIQALTDNSRNKLPMTRTDKSEAAWRLVRETKLSISATSKAAMVAPRTVSYMRKTWDALNERGLSIPEDIRWTDAQRIMKGQEKPRSTDDWIETEAQKIVDALLKANIGQGLMKNPDITARALRILNDDLPKALIREWRVEEADTIDEIVEELSRETAF